MPSFRWDQHFETGLPGIDEQHRRLVEVINRFGDLLGRSEETHLLQVPSIVGELARYAEEHFASEEGLMEREGVDPRHRSRQHGAHAGFIQEVNRLKGTASRSPLAAEALLRFLTHWLAYHILGTDQAMARQVAAIRAGTEPEEAFERHEHLSEGPMEPILAALDGLFRQVSETNRQLLELNRSLEAKVTDRTRALSEANRELVELIANLEAEKEASLKLGEALAEANRRLEDMAMTDVLTGLPNRRHAISWLEREWTRPLDPDAPLSCLMIDADGLKEVNDLHGHDAGDTLLKELAQAFRHRVRTDDVVCRLGGDEFLVFCPRTPLEGAVRVAEALRREVAGLRVPVGQGVWNGSVSIGAAVRGAAMANPDALIKAADEAVYAAKEQGGDHVATAPGPEGAGARRARRARSRQR